MPAFDPRDRREVRDAKGNAGYGGGGNNRSGGFGGAMGGASARRTANPTPSYDMTPGNLAKVGMMLGGTMLGAGPLTALGMMGRPLGAALGPSVGALTGFSGPRGTIAGPGDYDPSNRFGANGSALFPGQQRQGIQAAGAPRPMAQPQQPNPMLQRLQMPAQQFNVPGPSQYGVNLPSYGYFGQPPALKRPQPLMMGGI